MKRIAASKMGVTPSMSGAANSRAMTRAFETVEDDTQITLRNETYQASEPWVITRGNVGLIGGGSDKTAIEYTSSTDGSNYVGQCIRVGVIGADPPSNVTLRNFTCRDLNRRPLPYRGHMPAAVEVYWTENFIADGLGFEDIKGNSALSILGQARTDLEALTQLATVINCRVTGDTQGDGFNIGGVRHYDFLNNEAPRGGILRHFFEGGTGCLTALIRGCRVNMARQGEACVGSMTVQESAEISDCWFMDWSKAALSIAPDTDQLPVRGLTVERCTMASSAGLPAVQVTTSEVYEHVYTDNYFDCVLPFYFAKANKGPVVVVDNPISERVGTRKIAAVRGVTVDSDWLVEAA